jgi:acyl-CoA thioesterase FadM
VCDPRQAPFVAYHTPVRDAWIDYNGHANDACYTVMCTEATEVFLTALGIGEAYHAATGRTTYTVESHVRYLREARRGAVLRAETLLVDADSKRVRIHHSLRNGAGDEVATGEFLYLHVNQHTGRVEPMPADRQALVTDVLAAHATHPRPAHLVLGVPRTVDPGELGPQTVGRAPRAP